MSSLSVFAPAWIIAAGSVVLSSKAYAASSWTFSAGDPTLGGWFVTVSYLISAAFCFKSFLIYIGKGPRNNNLSRSEKPRVSLFWLFSCISLLGLGLNKQLDLQTLLLEIWGSNNSEDSALADKSASIKSFLILYAGSVVFAITAVIAHRKNHLKEISLALAGLGLVFIYIVFRAGTIHGFGGVVSLDSMVAQLVLFTESAGIFLVIFSAYNFSQKTQLTDAGVTEANTVD